MKYVGSNLIDSSVINGLEHIDGTLWIHPPPLDELLKQPPGSKSIVVLAEPRATHGASYRFVEEHYQKFHTIFTFDTKILASARNSKLLLFGITFLDKKDIDQLKNGFPQKTGLVSFICGSKIMIVGQRIRQAVYKRQMLLESFAGFPLKFWRSGQGDLLPPACNRGNPVLAPECSAKIKVHMPFRFSIVIENSQQENYFTEKIIDCFLCKTVPIYWGCPNISDFFSIKGILVLNGSELDVIKQLKPILRKCTHEFYQTMSSAIEENYLKAFDYAYTYSDRVKKGLEECFNASS